MRYPTHVVVFAKIKEGQFEKSSGDKESDGRISGWCFISTTQNSLLTPKVCDILFSMNAPLNSYHAILSRFDDTCA